MQALKKNGITAAFHYLPLHLSPYARSKETVKLKEAEGWGDCLVRIPLYFGITRKDQDFIIGQIKAVVKQWQ